MADEFKFIAWGCRTCNRIDWADVTEALAKPEHIPYRGVDLGTCEGIMVPLYMRNDEDTVNKQMEADWRKSNDRSLV